MKKLPIKRILEKKQRLKSQRANFETQWQDITDLCVPRKNNILNQKAVGEKRNFQVLDNTGMVSNELLAGALHGLLTNPYGEWFEYTTGDTTLDQDDDVRLWLQDAARKTINVINSSNFQTEVHELYIDLPSICTGCMYIEEDRLNVIRCSTKFIGDYLVDENYLGFVDEIYREWKWPANKIVAKFGIDKCPKEVKDAYTKGLDTQFHCVQAVYPKSLTEPGKAGYYSHYILCNPEVDLLVEQYTSFPYVVPRWSKATGEVYGRGPGMNALPELKVLNKMAETMLIGAQKVVDPPLQVEDDGVVLPLRTMPGGISFRRPGSDPIRPVFNDTRIDFGYQAMEDRRKRVRDAFYVDQLQLQAGGPMMTATEVMQRTEEKMRLLGPMLGRMQDEFLKPLIDRVFDIMLKRNMFLPIPAVLGGRKIDVRYSSFIAKAQRMSEAQNVSRGFQAIAPFIQLDPSVRDNFDGDKAVRLIAKTYSWPQELIKKQSDVDKKRQLAAEFAQKQAEQQQQAEIMESATKAAGVMSGIEGAGA